MLDDLYEIGKLRLRVRNLSLTNFMMFHGQKSANWHYGYHTPIQ